MRTGGGGGAGGATCGAGFATRAGALTGFAAVRVEEPRDGADLTGRRAVWAPFFAIRAGLRAEVRDFVTRRDFAIGGILASQTGPEGTVTNRVVYGQDPMAKSINSRILGRSTAGLIRAKQSIEFVNSHVMTVR